jgi:hypothetical protein
MRFQRAEGVWEAEKEWVKKVHLSGPISAALSPLAATPLVIVRTLLDSPSNHHLITRLSTW